MTMECRAEIVDGLLVVENERLLNEYLKRNEGKKMLVVVKPIRNQRSLNQNAYYHGVVLKILSEELGYFKDEMHDVLKNKFLHYVDEHGNDRTKSTSDLTTLSMKEYMDKIRSWALIEYAITIPEPNEQSAWNINGETDISKKCY